MTFFSDRHKSLSIALTFASFIGSAAITFSVCRPVPDAPVADCLPEIQTPAVLEAAPDVGQSIQPISLSVTLSGADLIIPRLYLEGTLDAAEQEKDDDASADTFIPHRVECFNVPLTGEQIETVIRVAEEFEIPPELMCGVMKVESRYQVDAIGKNGKYIGIMQIAESNLKRLKKRIGVTDLSDFTQNIRSGAYVLSYYYKKYDGDINKTLMCYHCGCENACKQWEKGVTEDSYCRKVAKEMDRIRQAYRDAAM